MMDVISGWERRSREHLEADRGQVARGGEAVSVGGERQGGRGKEVVRSGCYAEAIGIKWEEREVTHMMKGGTVNMEMEKKKKQFDSITTPIVIFTSDT